MGWIVKTTRIPSHHSGDIRRKHAVEVGAVWRIFGVTLQDCSWMWQRPMKRRRKNRGRCCAELTVYFFIQSLHFPFLFDEGNFAGVGLPVLLIAGIDPDSWTDKRDIKTTACGHKHTTCSTGGLSKESYLKPYHCFSHAGIKLQGARTCNLLSITSLTQLLTPRFQSQGLQLWLQACLWRHK